MLPSGPAERGRRAWPTHWTARQGCLDQAAAPAALYAGATAIVLRLNRTRGRPWSEHGRKLGQRGERRSSEACQEGGQAGEMVGGFPTTRRAGCVQRGECAAVGESAPEIRCCQPGRSEGRGPPVPRCRAGSPRLPSVELALVVVHRQFVHLCSVPEPSAAHSQAARAVQRVRVAMPSMQRRGAPCRGVSCYAPCERTSGAPGAMPMRTSHFSSGLQR